MWNPTLHVLSLERTSSDYTALLVFVFTFNEGGDMHVDLGLNI